MKKKIKSPFMIYADFESILVPEDNGKQNPSESYTNELKSFACCPLVFARCSLLFALFFICYFLIRRML